MTNPTALANDIRDIKPPVAIPSGLEWALCLFGVLAVLAILFALWWWRRERRARRPVPPVLPAHIRARQKLDEALALISRPKEFCILVSDTIRIYLGERFNFHAPERTTEEFLHELQTTELLVSEQKEKLGEFLESCDLVKFAKYEPGEPELRELHGSALRLVEETEPKEMEITPDTSSPNADGGAPSAARGARAVPDEIVNRKS